MEKLYCKHCNQTKYLDEFYAKNRHRCKLCHLAYHREWYKEKRMRKVVREQSCIGCGIVMRNPESKVCRKCCLKTRKFDIKTAADYSLSDDPLICGLIFLDACGNGVLEKFLENCYTAVDAFNDETQREPRVNVSDVDPNVLEKYQEHELQWYGISVLKSPRSRREAK